MYWLVLRLRGSGDFSPHKSTDCDRIDFTWNLASHERVSLLISQVTSSSVLRIHEFSHFCWFHTPKLLLSVDEGFNWCPVPKTLDHHSSSIFTKKILGQVGLF